MTSSIQRFFKRLLCKHTSRRFHRNIYGEEIIHSGYMRSIWLCNDCDKVIYQPKLHEEPKTVPDKVIAPANTNTVNSGYELTLAEAIRMAHRAQDIYAEHRMELDKLQNGGVCTLGPAGRVGFNSLEAVMEYLHEIEAGIKEVKRKIAEHAEKKDGSVPSEIKRVMKRIEDLK